MRDRTPGVVAGVGRMDPVTEPDVDALTDELYLVRPTDFVARRDHLVKRAREAGDRDLAAAIKALRRPTVGAWYLNCAARAGLVSLRDLLALGQRLRAAQAGGDFASLRDLAGQRSRLVADVVRDVTALLAEQGTAATPAGLDEVRSTLAAALADPDVADQVESGRLDRAHVYGGFGELLAVPPGAPGPRDVKAAAATGPTDDPGARRAAEEAERQRLAEARRELADAESALADVSRRRAEVEQETQDLAERIASLTGQLNAAKHELAVVEAERKDAVAEEQRATRRVERARRTVEG